MEDFESGRCSYGAAYRGGADYAIELRASAEEAEHGRIITTQPNLIDLAIAGWLHAARATVIAHGDRRAA
jgi:hypothetical protein